MSEFHTTTEEIYTLQEGQPAHSRLKWQSDIYRGYLKKAFNMAAAIKDLSGLTVVDFGCGTSEIYDDVTSFIGSSGTYIGIDSSVRQLSFARAKHPTVEYIIGGESSAEVRQAIFKADLLYMRFVVMHQKQPAEFVKMIYGAMKPGAILIMQEPEDTPECKDMMLKKYQHIDGIGELYDFKKTISARIGINYDIAKDLKDIFADLKPNNLKAKAENVLVSSELAKPLLEKCMSEFESKCVPHGILSQKEINVFLATIAKLPCGKNDLWSLGKCHTIVGQKPELS